MASSLLKLLKSGRPIVYIKGLHVQVIFFLFLSLKIVFSSASSTDPDEMSHYAVCQSKVYLFKRFPELKRKHIYLLNLRDLFHVYLNRYEFHFFAVAYK